MDLLWQVFWVALATDLATGLGALPFFFVRTLSRRLQGWAYAIAGGMMISASVFSLAEQGLGRGPQEDNRYLQAGPALCRGGRLYQGAS